MCKMWLLKKETVYMLVTYLVSYSKQYQYINLADARIIGGDEVTPHSIPFQVFLNFSGNDNTTWTCGGTLITSKYILTAGRCGYGASLVDITLGAHDLSTTESTQVKLQSQDITVHQNFKKDVSAYVYENDIAVISLSEQIVLTDYIKLVQVATDVAEDEYVNKTGKVIGWGQTDAYDGSSLSSVLLSQENTIISNEECAFVYYDLKNYDICMKTAEGRSPCVGDYGSPLTVDQVQVGIASQNVMYCIPGYPFVYTRISSFVDWIKENTDYLDSNDVTTTPIDS